MNEKWKWIAVIVAILVGAGLAVFGIVTGEQWTALAGTLITGGGGYAAGKAAPRQP